MPRRTRTRSGYRSRGCIMPIILLVTIVLFAGSVRSACALDISGYMIDTEGVQMSLYHVTYDGELIYSYVIPETIQNDNSTETFIFRGLPDGGKWVVTPLKGDTWFIPASVTVDNTWGLD